MKTGAIISQSALQKQGPGVPKPYVVLTLDQ